jgi:hypothetical protein
MASTHTGESPETRFGARGTTNPNPRSGGDDGFLFSLSATTVALGLQDKCGKVIGIVPQHKLYAKRERGWSSTARRFRRGLPPSSGASVEGGGRHADLQVPQLRGGLVASWARRSSYQAGLVDQ